MKAELSKVEIMINDDLDDIKDEIIKTGRVKELIIKENKEMGIRVTCCV